MKFNIITLSLIFVLAFFTATGFSQTQTEIEQMLKDSKEKENSKTKKENTKKKSLKKELKEREKEINSKNKEKNIKKIKPPKEKNIKEKKLKKVKKTKETDNKTEDNFSKLSFNKIKKIGDKLSSKGSFYNALEFYNKALFKAKNDKKKLYIYNKLANTNYALRDYKRAENYYIKAISLNTKGKKYPMLEFQLASSYKYLAKYDTSILMFKKFITKQADNKKIGNALRKARIEIKGSKYALEYFNDEPKFVVENAGENVNGPFSDYGPEILGEKLYFSKINTDKVIVLDNEIKEKEFSKIFYSEKNKDDFEIFQDFAENVNTKNIHVGNPSFSKDGNNLYFTKCTINDNMQSNCKIYVSKKEDNIWQEAELLNSDINLEKTNNTQPQISEFENGKQILYFVSDRTTGKGGKDIWYVNIDEEGKFSRVINAGFKINTSFDDISPFYSQESKTLYFSSNGRTSFGGFDVFKLTKNEDNEREEYVKNLGLPINSSLDDYDFVLNNKETNGFLSSNRIGTTTLRSETCCDDIFKVNLAAIDIYVTGKIYAENATSRTVLKDVDVYLTQVEGNKKLQQLDYENANAFVVKVEKDKDYKLRAIANNFQDVELIFSTKGITKSDTLQYDLFMKNRDLTGKVLTVIYYEFDSARLKEGAIDSLRKVVTFMTAYPNMIIEVGSHTDSKGSDQYNNKLSERRSLSVKNYLIYQKNISEESLLHKSFGESEPVAPNTNSDGSDNPEGRDLNRRTEFKVVGYLEDK